MTLKEILEIYPENNWHKADGFDDCVMGIVHSFSGESILAYDYYKIIEKLMKTMTQDEAIEHFNYNIVGSYVGEKTPIYIER